jgi:hypothetical protein
MPHRKSCVPANRSLTAPTDRPMFSGAVQTPCQRRFAEYYALACTEFPVSLRNAASRLAHRPGPAGSTRRFGILVLAESAAARE